MRVPFDMPVTPRDCSAGHLSFISQLDSANLKINCSRLAQAQAASETRGAELVRLPAVSGSCACASSCASSCAPSSKAPASAPGSPCPRHVGLGPDEPPPPVGSGSLGGASGLQSQLRAVWSHFGPFGE